MFDTTQLTSTSSKRGLRWRDPSLTFIWLRADGPIVSAYTVADKSHVLDSCAENDRILAVRRLTFPTHQEVMVIDDLGEVRRSLDGDG
jgi:hypothetical protein